MYFISIHAQEEHQFSLGVKGACAMCQERIESIATSIRGVHWAIWDQEDQRLFVNHDGRADREKLAKLIARAGHDTELVEATAAAYDQLPKCCQYEAHAVHEVAMDLEKEGLHGLVVDGQAEVEEAIVGATVYWMTSTEHTITDEEGYFHLQNLYPDDYLIIHSIGYEPDTLLIGDKHFIKVTKREHTMLDEVVITERIKSSSVSFLNAAKMTLIDEKELYKAACCNLSESFETNAAVDASATDAVSGTRQIKMLGLDGPNVLMTREAIPTIRGQHALYGLQFMPGPWIKGMSINTGSTSVINGFDGITGQIDLTIKQPNDEDRLFVNLFANEMSRLEANVVANADINDRMAHSILLHANTIPTKHDVNDDSFLDHPVSRQYSGMYRWRYVSEDGWRSQFGVSVTDYQSRSGQSGFDFESPENNPSRIWGAENKMKLYDGWAKVGYVFPEKPYNSFGLQISGTRFEQESYFGTRSYDSEQSTMYLNLGYQTILADTRYQWRAGLSYQWDEIEETLVSRAYARTESVPGLYSEFTYIPSDRWTVVAGLRGDYHNHYGGFVTPRLHVRYAPSEQLVFRISGGRAQRTVSIIAEQVGGLASNREFLISNEGQNEFYGMPATIGWNFGFSTYAEFRLFGMKSNAQFDVYQTKFTDQVVVDWDANRSAVMFYPLEGRSRANNIQLELDMELMPRWDLTMAYRYNDVGTTYHDHGFRQVPYVSRHRFFINQQLSTPNGWSLDATMNWIGAQRLPDTPDFDPTYDRPEYSPDYVTVNFQISKSWNHIFDLYLGAVNVLNYRQKDPIVSATDPLDPFFDASMIWAPVFGREFYAGLRYRIKRD